MPVHISLYIPKYYTVSKKQNKTPIVTVIVVKNSWKLTTWYEYMNII